MLFGHEEGINNGMSDNSVICVKHSYSLGERFIEIRNVLNYIDSSLLANIDWRIVTLR